MEATRKRIYRPFERVIIPVFPDMKPEKAISLARNISDHIWLIGLVTAISEEEYSQEAGAARKLREFLNILAKEHNLTIHPKVFVSSNPSLELRKFLSEDRPDLMVMEYPLYFENSPAFASDMLATPPCDIAISSGMIEEARSILVPLRGGPYAELALRVSLALPHKKINALHLTAPGSPEKVDAPFRGLARILPSLTDVKYHKSVSGSLAETIINESQSADLLVMGVSALPASMEKSIGSLVRVILEQVNCPLVMVKTHTNIPLSWFGEEGERAGVQAISLLVDRWFAENTYHADEFDDLDHLVSLKKEQNLKISLALPALNEEETVGQVISAIKQSLMENKPLLDEIVLIDSNSTDRTRDIAAQTGVPVHIHQKLLPAYGAREGKGEALWKSLMVTQGDLIIWIDTDIVNIHPRFVYGVIGPLLANPRLQLVKGFYRRPLKDKETLLAGGGRVTELAARPLINLFYPELSGVIQPLAGEYGGRRKALEKLPFFSGYGVEIGLLIDMLENFGLSSIAQVDLLERIHHNQDLEALSKMSFAILQAVTRKLEKRLNRALLEEVNKTMKLIRNRGENYYLEVEEVIEMERPPMIELAEYNSRFGKTFK